jgi:hypothetical protein
MTLLPISATALAAGARLTELANGEYTAASVAVDVTAAIRLGLVKQPDGNYATTPPPAPAGVVAAAQSAPGVLSAVVALPLGGA